MENLVDKIQKDLKKSQYLTEYIERLCQYKDYRFNLDNLNEFTEAYINVYTERLQLHVMRIKLIKNFGYNEKMVNDLFKNFIK